MAHGTPRNFIRRALRRAVGMQPEPTGSPVKIVYSDRGNILGAIFKWGFKSSMKYPMNILLAVFKLEEKLGNDLQNSLSNLKNVLETNTIYG